MSKLHRYNLGLRSAEKTPFGNKYLLEQMARLELDKPSAAIEKIFEEHARMTQQLQQQEILVESIYQRLKKDLDVIRVRTGYADKNARINLELWNGYILANDQTDYITTDEYLTTPLQNAQKKVEDTIAGYQAKKIEKEKLKSEKQS